MKGATEYNRARRQEGQSREVYENARHKPDAPDDHKLR